MSIPMAAKERLFKASDFLPAYFPPRYTVAINTALNTEGVAPVNKQ